MKSFILLGLLACGGHMACAQTSPTPPAAATTPLPAQPCATYSGHVTGDGKPLVGATVAVPGTRVLITTNGEGFFTLTLPPTAQPTVQVSAAGYQPQSLTLTSCDPLAIELQLLPGTRIKKRGKRKGYIMKTTEMNPAAH